MFPFLLKSGRKQVKGATGERKNRSISLIIRLFLSSLVYDASKKTNIYSILLAFYLLEENQNGVLQP